MLKVPQGTLRKLVCARCGGYLSVKPIMLNKEGEQICGKCFEILPSDDKENYVRQVGLEAIAEILIFPCRYNLQGCTYTFIWNNGKEHETACPYRHNTLPVEEISRLSNSNAELAPDPEFTEFVWENDQINLKVKYENINNVNFESDDRTKVHVEISGNHGNTLSLFDPIGNKEKSDIVLNIESLLSSKSVPEVQYCHLNVTQQTKENPYESITYYNCNNYCNSCKRIIIHDEIFNCLFGHNSCKKCKGKPCLICGREILGESRIYCKNLERGCTKFFTQIEIKKHECDCEFNDFNCLILDCQFVDTLDRLINHFIAVHKSDVTSSHELKTILTRKDKKWYFYCYNKIFCCFYYYFAECGEFIVKYIGSNDNAKNYGYEICIFSDNNCVKKMKAKCLGWNEVSLAKGISYDFTNNSNSSHNFNRSKLEVHISIIYQSE